MKIYNFYKKLMNGEAIFTAIFFAIILLSATNTFAADGDLDASFNGSGIVTDNFGGSFGIFTRTVKIQTDGKILTGSAVLGADFQNYDFGILRYNSNGTLDTTFGTNGRQIVDVDGGSETLPTILLQSDGKIIVVGQRIVTGQGVRGIVLTRLNSNGFFDTSFGANGKVITTFDSANKVAANLQTDGKIVVAGSGLNNGSTVTARYLNTAGSVSVNNPTLRFADFDGDGKTDLAVWRNGTFYIKRANGAFSAVQFGAANDAPIAAAFVQ